MSEYEAVREFISGFQAAAVARFGVNPWPDYRIGQPIQFYEASGRPIPEGAMRVAPGSDAVVWKVSPEHSGEL